MTVMHDRRRMAVHHRVDVRPSLVDFAVDEALTVKQRVLSSGCTGWLSRSSARMSEATTNSGAIERDIR